MGKDGVGATGIAPTGGELTISLDAPGMTALHRVGVAGLWMTLDTFDANPGLAAPLRAAGGSWSRDDRAVTLRWEQDGAAFLNALIRASFRLDQRHGLIYFPALGPPTEYRAHAVLLQEALLGTFLQHGKVRRADPATKRSPLASGDEEAGEQVTLLYRRVDWYTHQDARIDPDQPLTVLAGWQYPGGAVRHTGLGDASALADPPDRYLALLYAPVAAYYFQLRARTRKVRPQYCLVLPEPGNLAEYTRRRKGFRSRDARQYVAAGGGEAALRVLLHLEMQELLTQARTVRCRVVEFGVVPWASQQKTRISLLEVAPGSADGLRAFDAVRRVLQPSRVVLPNGDSFVQAPQTPDLVARNVINGLAWWRGFGAFIDDLDRRKAVLTGERKGLAEMVTHFLTGAEPEAIFVRACHEAWRRRLGALAERASSNGLDAKPLFKREFERQRVSFARCKNQATLREVMTDFWSRARGLPVLQEGWLTLLPFLGERWQEGRDLALLALASYRGKTEEERAALEQDTHEVGEDDQ